MKVTLDGKQILELSETQKRVIKNDIPDEVFDADMERRLNYILTHKYEQCFKRLQDEWMPRLAQRVPSVPTAPDAFAQLVFSQPDYKSRSQREAQAEREAQAA